MARRKWAKGRNPALYQVIRGEWRLTTAERKRILLNNIYGVDIDSQAVEVTKLSLLLKVLEGENEQTLANQLRLFHERALPDLGNNIKCGNSLIGPDFYDNQQLGFFDDEEQYRINVFDWKKEFPDIFKDGGFDAVIGNPPYVRIQALKEWAPLEVEFYKICYTSASKGNYDIYVVFVEKGLELLNRTGRLGFILPHKFFNAQYGEPLRTLLSKGNHLSDIVHFGDRQVFTGATTYTCLLFLDKAGTKSVQFKKVEDLNLWRSIGKGTEGKIPSSSITSSEWNLTVGRDASLFEKMKQMPVRLGDVARRIFQGLVTGADQVFILKDSGIGQYYSEATQQEYNLESELMHPLCKGSLNIKRYHVSELSRSILFPYKIIQGKAKLISVQEMTVKYPIVWEYLRANQQMLESRERGKWKHDRWYAFGRSQNLSEMEQVKILTPSIASKSSFTLDSGNFYYFVGSGGGGGGGYGITLHLGEVLKYEYILGLLNSKLLDMFLRSLSSPFSSGYYAYNRQYIEQLPVRKIDFPDPADKARHDRMVAMVEQMLALHKKLAAAKAEHDKTVLQRQIEATDRQIDRLVYELYGLNDDEIKIVEGNGTIA